MNSRAIQQQMICRSHMWLQCKFDVEILFLFIAWKCIVTYLIFSHLSLCDRDPHQLLELMCMELRCILIAYNDDLKQKLKNGGVAENPVYDSFEVLKCKFTEEFKLRLSL